MQIRDCKSLCLSTLYTGCIPPRYIVTMVRYWLCLSTLYTGCILKLSRNRAPRSCFASAHSIQVASVFCSFIYNRKDPFASAHSIQVASKTSPTGFLNANFASAHSIQVASLINHARALRSDFASAHSIQVASDNPEKYQYNPVLCLSTLYTGCITFYVEYYALICALPQHTLYRLHRLWHPPTESVPSFASAHSIQVASMFDSYDTFAMVFASAHSIQVAS